MTDKNEMEVSDLDFATTLKTSIKTELIAVLTQMTNEFDLVFDYIPKDNISKLRSLIAQLESYAPTQTSTTQTEPQPIENILKQCHEKLQPFEQQIFQVVNCDRKIKTDDLLFLNNIQLFDGVLDFGLFKDESKNTKRSVVKYLHSIYMSSCFFSIDLGDHQSSETLTATLSAFVDTLQNKMNDADTTLKTGRHTPTTPRRINRMPKNGHQDPTAVFNGLFSSILDNPDIMNMATDLSRDLQREQVDPMSLISGLMSGRPNPQLNRLVGNITSKIEQKLSSGEISQDALEAQATNIMNAVNESDLVKQIPILKELGQFKK